MEAIFNTRFSLANAIKKQEGVAATGSGQPWKSSAETDSPNEDPVAIYYFH
jgi:hypothetical protein